MNRAYRPVLHTFTNNKLSASSLEVLKLKDIYRQTANGLLRGVKERSDFTALGREIWDRAERDAEIRHKHTGSGMNRRDLLCSLLDIRTKHGGHLSEDEYKEARKILRSEYLQYAMKVERQLREAMRPVPAAAAELAAAAVGLAAAAAETAAVEAATRGDVAPATPANAAPVRKRPRSGLVVQRNRFLDTVGDADVEVVDEEVLWEESTLLHHTKQFETIEREWLQLEVDWASEFPQLAPLAVVEPGQPKYEFDMVYDLWDLDLGEHYSSLIEAGKYGFLPHMFLARNGSTLSAGYVERCNSAGKMIYPVGRKSLGLFPCEMLVMLRMNEKFYKHFEGKFGNLLIEMAAKVDLSVELATWMR